MDQLDGPTGISVNGTGRVSVNPDIATVTVGVSVEDGTLEAARSAVAVKTSAAKSQLLASGVAEGDITTTRLNVNNWHDNQRRRQVFSVATSLSAVIRDLGEAESVVHEMFGAVGEGLELHDLRFGVEDRTTGREQALTLAFEDAAVKARHLAGLAGAQLGSVLAITEGQGRQPGPRPMARMAMSGAEASAEIPIEAGDLEIVATVAVRWSLD